MQREAEQAAFVEGTVVQRGHPVREIQNGRFARGDLSVGSEQMDDGEDKRNDNAMHATRHDAKMRSISPLSLLNPSGEPAPPCSAMPQPW